MTSYEASCDMLRSTAIASKTLDMTYNFLLIQWAPLNRITVEGIIWLMGSNLTRLNKFQCLSIAIGNYLVIVIIWLMG